MEYKKYTNKYLLRLDPGEEIVESITKVAETEKIKLASITGIGAVNKVRIGVFDTQNKQYLANNLNGIFEILALSGNISTMDNKEYIHLHISIGNEKGQALGGHLNEAFVSATAEIIIDVVDGKTDREFSNSIGLNILKF